METEDKYHYLPTKEGGFIKKRVSNMSINEKEFIRLTKDRHHYIDGDTSFCIAKAKELLYPFQ